MTESRLAGLHAVDLFAGTGVGVAMQRLGIIEHGVEIMPEARATREANGMRNWLADVWDVLETADPDSPEFKSAIAWMSPPCQTFSMAGRGKGREALDEVLGLIDSRAYLDPAKLREFGERHDPRTALVLTPLTYVARHIPMYVVLEQVPPVLPVWERMATELRGWGYSVWCGILHAEQYGVPQTRTRAVLIARNDGVAAAPPSLHTRGITRPILPSSTRASCRGSRWPRRSDGGSRDGRFSRLPRERTAPVVIPSAARRLEVFFSAPRPRAAPPGARSTLTQTCPPQRWPPTHGLARARITITASRTPRARECCRSRRPHYRRTPPISPGPFGTQAFSNKSAMRCRRYSSRPSLACSLDTSHCRGLPLST